MNYRSLLHSNAASYPQEPTQEEKESLIGLMNNL
jgi:hypothetical protein